MLVLQKRVKLAGPVLDNLLAGTGNFGRFF
jgi:hypothetical protein